MMIHDSVCLTVQIMDFGKLNVAWRRDVPSAKANFIYFLCLSECIKVSSFLLRPKLMMYDTEIYT